MHLGERLAKGENSLNALRLGFAVLVIVSHSASLTGRAEPAFAGISIGAWALNGFFAISGYLIPLAAQRAPTLAYLRRRAERIYPGFWAMLLVVAFGASPAAAHLTHSDFQLGRAINFVLLNASTLMVQPDIGAETAHVPSSFPYWNAAAWTICLEVCLYLLVAAMFIPQALRRRQVVPASILLALGVVLTVAGPGRRDVTVCVAYFGAGWLVCLARERLRPTAATAAISMAGTIALAFVSPAIAALPASYAVLATGALLPIRLFRRNDISYGTYLYAWPMQQLLAISGLGRVGLPQFALLSTCLALTAGSASWFLVERRFLRRARPVDVAPPVASHTEGVSQQFAESTVEARV